MRVLVTGASGFVGSRVCSALETAGHTVVAVSGRSDPVSTAGTWITADLLHVDSLDGVGSVDAVAHLAAVLPGTGVPDDSVAEMNRQIDDTVFSFARKLGAQVVFASTTAVYGQGRSEESLRECRTPVPKSRYAEQKLRSEHVARELELRFTALRICAPYGPAQRVRTVMQRFTHRAAMGEPLLYHGTGAREQDFTWVDDIAAAFVKSFAGVNGTYNIAGGQPISMLELATLVARVAGLDESMAQRSGEDDPQEGLRARFSIDLAERNLGWVPRMSLPDGIAACVAAHRRARK